MDWKVLSDSRKDGNVPRNPDMKRRRRPLFPAFEADLVKFIQAHLKEDNDKVTTIKEVESNRVNKENMSRISQATSRKRALTEALILEEAQRLKKVHGVSDDMLVLSVGWLARFKHRHCIRLRTPAGTSSKCSLPLFHQIREVGEHETESGSMDACSLHHTLPRQNEHIVPRQAVADATVKIAGDHINPLPAAAQTKHFKLADGFAKTLGGIKTGACSAQWHRAEPSVIITSLLSQIPDNIHELGCSCQRYFCEDVLIHGLKGLRVAVMGLGSVVDAFLAAALVGADGFVTCVEASLTNVNLAEQTAESYCLITLGLPAVNMKFITGGYGGITSYPSSSCVVDNDLLGQTELVVCNCSIESLQFPASMNTMLELAFSLLKIGGELRVTDLVCSRRLSSSECQDAAVAVESSAVNNDSAHRRCKQSKQTLLLSAPYIGDLRRLFTSLGGDVEVRTVSCDDVEATAIESTVASLLPALGAVNDVKFRRITFRAFRLQSVENPGEDYGQRASFTNVDARNLAASGQSCFPSSYQLDDTWTFIRDVCTHIDGNTAQILQTSWLRRYFKVSGDRSRHRGPFQPSVRS
ncbi:hypothetical protein PsorP6_008034 [Peronosclerospora sorghi]|uniref:Uncharacterized protein n=1 Tax=Peronosclerospora sorghi TaxID=230839 RepID=A0ACC0W7S0_9STRA|nr:hypothetical protein PsorP6_008034 [Peronosclerospora sorghi]